MVPCGMAQRGLFALFLFASGLGAASCFEAANVGPGVFCRSEGDCAANTGFTRCDPFRHECVAPDTNVASRCAQHADCKEPGTPVCDPGFLACRACTGDGDDASCAARGDGSARCDAAAGRCVACRADTASTDCALPTSPVCESGSCRGCRAHAECATGVCLDDGSCARLGDVAWVDNKDQPCKVAPRTGSREDPYCEIGEAVAALGSRTHIRVVGRSRPYASFTTEKSKVEIRVVGPGRDAQPRATISEPGKPCVTVDINTAASIDGMELRGCTIGLVTYQARVTLRRSVLRENTDRAVELHGSMWPHIVDSNLIVDNGGGVTLYAVVFDVRNNYIANNKGVFGGVFTDALALGSLAFNTIRDNRSSMYAGGVECSYRFAGGKIAIANSIVFGNTAGVDGNQWSENCQPLVIAAGAKASGNGVLSVDPDFEPGAPGYRLRAAPANEGIVDAVAAGDNRWDIDGRPRPAGTEADLGCFERQ